jgi:hypothetical protein
MGTYLTLRQEMDIVKVVARPTVQFNLFISKTTHDLSRDQLHFVHKKHLEYVRGEKA